MTEREEYSRATLCRTVAGERIALSTCLTCGATVLIDLDTPVNAPTLHDQWHTAQRVTA